MKLLKRISLMLAMLAVMVTPTLMAVPTAEAANFNPFQVCGRKGAGQSDVCKSRGGENQIFSTGRAIVNTLLLVAGLVAVILIVIAGLRYTMSAGDAKNQETARNTIIYASIGLALAVAAYAIVNFVVNGL